MKSGRHAKILEIISEYPVETQDEIISRLKEAGYRATQATISRDIKDLRLVKTLGSDGRYRYISAANRKADLRSNFAQLFYNSVISIDCAQNIVVIKTLSGMANAVCAAMDDDTIFVACRSNESAISLNDSLKQYITNKSTGKQHVKDLTH